MDYTTRTLIRVTIDDFARADDTFSMLMGEKVPPRRKFTIRNMVKRLYSEGANLIVEMKNRTKANKGLQAIVQSLVDQIQRRQSAL